MWKLQSGKRESGINRFGGNIQTTSANHVEQACGARLEDYDVMDTGQAVVRWVQC
jgi:hypothetical protein